MVLSVTWRLYRLRPSAGRYDKDVYAARSLARVTYTMRAARCARSVPQEKPKRSKFRGNTASTDPSFSVCRAANATRDSEVK